MEERKADRLNTVGIFSFNDWVRLLLGVELIALTIVSASNSIVRPSQSSTLKPFSITSQRQYPTLLQVEGETDVLALA